MPHQLRKTPEGVPDGDSLGSEAEQFCHGLVSKEPSNLVTGNFPLDWTQLSPLQFSLWLLS
jgi:hypothetical protein